MRTGDAKSRKTMTSWAKVILADSRSMEEVAAGGVDLIVTSPPYWHIKDYGAPDQIGYGQSLHEYLIDLYRVWTECFRVLGGGSRLCVNIGDQFARATTYGRYRVIPLHAEIITQCEKIGFDFMGSIIWQKKTTMNTSGGATVMGSFPYPSNGIVEIDYEYIHVFKKTGRSRRVSKEIKEASRLTKDQWKDYFKGHWSFGGAKKIGHDAMFPLELPRRLIKMFSFVGDTVLDPFVGSGTTLRAGLGLQRNVIGYEINEGFMEIIETKVGPGVEVIRRQSAIPLPEVTYSPGIQDTKPGEYSGERTVDKEDLHKVTAIVDAQTLEVDSHLRVEFLGVNIDDEAAALEYLDKCVLGGEVFLRYDDGAGSGETPVRAYVYLKNRIFINSHLIKSGIGSPDPSGDHRLAAKFTALRPRTGS
jgi:DNA modification methylase